jgi:hypothetical protein
MKLIMKADLSMHDGLILDKDNNVLCLPALVDEVNELVDLVELIAFVKKNEPAIQLAAQADKFVTFTPTESEKPVITSADTAPATPLTDEAKAAAEAIANEYLDVRKHDDVNADLKRYSSIASFLDKDYILIDEGDCYNVVRLKMDPLKLTEKFVVSTIKEYHDPAIRKLLAGVVIGR